MCGVESGDWHAWVFSPCYSRDIISAALGHPTLTHHYCRFLMKREPSSVNDDVPTPVTAVAVSRGSWLAGALRDFVRVKRVGYHNVAMDAVGLGLLLSFGACFAWGMRTGSALALLLGLWGCLTSLQSYTGILQFTRYQREGWSLLIAVCALGGYVGGIVYGMGRRRRWFRLSAGLTVVALAFWAFLTPPAHVVFVSPAEDGMVRWIKNISAYCCSSSRWPSLTIHDADEARVLRRILPASHPFLVTRKMAGFTSGQGELVFAVGEPMPALVFSTKDCLEALLEPHRQYVVLVETASDDDALPVADGGMTAKVNSEMTGEFLRVRKEMMAAGHQVQSFLSSQASARWVVTQETASPGLDVVILTPRDKAAAGLQDHNTDG